MPTRSQLTYTAPEPQPTLQPEPAPTLETTPALEPEPAPAGVTVELGDITDLQRPQFLVGELDGGAETVNRYRFTISEPKKLGLGLRQQETNADLVLVDAEGAELRAARKAGAANEWITVTLLAGAYEAADRGPGGRSQHVHVPLRGRGAQPRGRSSSYWRSGRRPRSRRQTRSSRPSSRRRRRTWPHPTCARR